MTGVSGVPRSEGAGTRRFQEAVTMACLYSPFLARVLRAMSLHADESVGTAAVSIAPLRLRYAPSFFDSLDQWEALGVLVHEVLHLAHLSFSRMPAANLNHDLWNLAADAVINEAVFASKLNGVHLSLPKGCVTVWELSKRGFQGLVAHETIYAWLLQQSPKILERFRPLDDHSGLYASSSPRDTTETGVPASNRAFLRQVFNEALRLGWGSLGGEVSLTISNLVKPKVDWRRLLRRYLSDLLAESGAIPSLRSWLRPSSRRPGMPSWRRLETEPLVVAVDVSGSHSHLFSQMMAEVEALVQDREICLLCFDTRIQLVRRNYRPGDWRKLSLLGGGGTSVKCLFEWMRENRLTRSPLLVLTDGLFSSFFDTFGVRRILWAIPDWFSCEGLPGRVLRIGEVR